MEPGVPVRTQRRPNYSYTIFSVALVLLLLGLFGLWLWQAAQLGRQLQEKVDILVELREDVDENDRNGLIERMGKHDFIREESIRFRSRDKALEEMGDEISRDLVELDLPNPFRDMLIFNVGAEYLKEDSLAQMATILRQEASVYDVYYQETFIGRVVENARRLAFVFLGFAVLLVLIVVVLIHNTVRLSLYSNRFLIKTQELVGATWGFISRPYLRRALLHGAISGLLAVTGLAGIQLWLQQQLPELRLFEPPEVLIIGYAVLVLLGMLISWLSHYSVVRRYLRMRVDDLY